MKGQAVIIILLGLIVLKLYPSTLAATGPISWVILVIVVLAFLIVSFMWLIVLIGDWIDNKEKRKKEKSELREITKTLKQIDNINKRVK